MNRVARRERDEARAAVCAKTRIKAVEGLIAEIENSRAIAVRRIARPSLTVVGLGQN